MSIKKSRTTHRVEQCMVRMATERRVAYWPAVSELNASSRIVAMDA